MAITAFITVSFCLSVLFGCLLFFKQGERRFRFGLPLLVLSVALLFRGLAGKTLAVDAVPFSSRVLLCAFLALSFFVLQSIIELLSSVLIPEKRTASGIPGIAGRISGLWLARFVAVAGITFSVFSRNHGPFFGEHGEYIFPLDGVTITVYIARLLLDLGLFVVLEYLYRYAKPYQRRRGRSAFIAFLLLAVFDMVFTVHSLLFSTLTEQYILASMAVYAICIPLGLFGLARYRLAEERIVFSTESIYSSFSLLLAGAFFLVLGITVGSLQSFGIQFSYFEEYVGGLLSIIFVALAIGSPRVRVRLRRLLNKHFYRSKHNYRDQFFRLHETYMAGERIEDSIEILLENLSHGAALGEALVFLRDRKDGNFHLWHCRGATAQGPDLIDGDGPLVLLFENDGLPCIFAREPGSERVALARREGAVQRLGITALFPVTHRKELLGFLALRESRGPPLDDEDIDLIRVFTVSIGNVYFKYRMIEEHVELKQFESFNHIASFIVHDIKNQVATLSLLSKNAENNITDPDFQKSLLRSLGSCCGNLQSLIAKIATPVGQKDLVVAHHDVNIIVGDVLAEGVRILPSVRLESRLEASKTALIDRESIFYIVKNLVINAIEAMNGDGTLTVATGDLSSLPPDIKERFGIGEGTFARNGVYILIGDTGCGMSKDFLEHKLFRPFVSTKDKGIGIGLYQCRVLMEKMGGKLICVSQESAGTQFCCIM